MGIGRVVWGVYFPLQGEGLRNWKRRMTGVLAPRGYRFTRLSRRMRRVEEGIGNHSVGCWKNREAPPLEARHYVVVCPQGGSPLEFLMVFTHGLELDADSPSHSARYRDLVAAGVLHAVAYASGGANRPVLPGDGPVGRLTQLIAWWQSCFRHYWGAPDAARLLLMMDDAFFRAPSQGYGTGLDRRLFHRLNLLGCPELVQRWEVGRVRRELARDPRFARAASNPPH